MEKNALYSAIIYIASCPAYAASSGFETYGDIGQFALPALAAGIAWYNNDNEGLNELGYSLFSTTATVTLLKNTMNSTRPNGGSKSFPSGHTAWAFSGASYIQIRYGWEHGLPAYLAAGAVGWSRVESNNHYWRDVIAGAVLATGLSYVFTSPHKAKQFAFYPKVMEGNAKGVGITFLY